MKLLPPKARPGDRVAILSPSLAAPGFAPAVHEQAMTRLAALTGLVPVEYPTTRQLGASPEERARDLNAAFADPSIRAILATVGGDDQIAVIPHLDGAAALSMQVGVPLVPIAMLGGHEAMPVGRFLPKFRSEVCLFIGRPMKGREGESAEAYMARVFHAIELMLEQHTPHPVDEDGTSPFGEFDDAA